MTKRVYSETVKKWAKNLGISGGTLIGLIFLYLFAIGAISNVSYSGDSICAGTESDPCYAFINFTANEDIFLYPIDYDPWGRNTIFSFDPNVKSWKLERSWGDDWRNIPLDKSCTGTWCGLSNSEDKREFSVAFRKGKDYKLRITGYKNNPNEDIKWGAFSGVDEIDPVWRGTYSNKYNVSFEFSKNGIIHKCLDITIRNLQDSSDNINLKTILNETNFDINKLKNLKFFEYKSEEIIKDTYEKVCNPFDYIDGNGTKRIDNNCTNIVSGNYIEEIWKWKKKSLLITDKEGKKELRNTFEQFNIQKAKQEKDTKKFRMCFDTPIQETKDGWGNSGTIYLKLNEELFYDKTHSSWWNSNWDRKRKINITELSGNYLINYSVKLNITYDSDMQSDFDDLRFTDSSESNEFNYWIEDKENDNYANVWVFVDNLLPNINTSIYMYYGNAGANSESNKSKSFLLYDDFVGDLNTNVWNSSQVWYAGERSGIYAVDCYDPGYTWTKKEGYIEISGESTVDLCDERGLGDIGWFGQGIRTIQDFNNSVGIMVNITANLRSYDGSALNGEWWAYGFASDYDNRLQTELNRWDAGNEYFDERVTEGGIAHKHTFISNIPWQTGEWNWSFVQNGTQINANYNNSVTTLNSTIGFSMDSSRFYMAVVGRGYYTRPDTINVTVSDVQIRSYTYPEPTYSVLSEVISGTCDLNLSWGPDINIFRFATCGSGFENASARPQSQNSTHGIDYVCNNGTVTEDVQIKLSSSLNSNWSWYASNESDFTPQINLNTSWQTIHENLAVDSCIYIWHGANCSYVTQKPGPYEQYQCV